MKYLPGIALYGSLAVGVALFWYGVWILVSRTFGPSLWDKIVWASGDLGMIALVGLVIWLTVLYREAKKEWDEKKGRRGV